MHLRMGWEAQGSRAAGWRTTSCVWVCVLCSCACVGPPQRPPASPAFSLSPTRPVSVPGPPLLWAAPWELMSTGQADPPGVTRDGPDSILSLRRHLHGHTRLNFLCGSPQVQPVEPGHAGCGARRNGLPALPPHRPVPVHVPLARGHHLGGLQLRHLPPSRPPGTEPAAPGAHDAGAALERRPGHPAVW